jgi:uncharacterized Ntn-hydrolase superfamily protein
VRLGICLASSPLTVASCCPFVRAGVGTVSTQANTNPKLGPAPLDLLDAVDDLRCVFDAFKPLTPYYQGWPRDPAMND